MNAKQYSKLRATIPIEELRRRWREEARRRAAKKHAINPPLPRSHFARLMVFCNDASFRNAFLHVCLNRIKTFKVRPVLVSDELRKKRDKETARIYRAKNIEKFREWSKLAARERRRNGKDAAYMKKRLQDPAVRLAWINRSRIHSALKRQSASKMVRSIMGCNAQELKVHIESQFKPGMTWKNQGKVPGTWQIDHIRPLSSFNLHNKEEQAKAFHYSNMQPLWFEENNKKLNHWNGRQWRYSDHGKALVA